LPRRRRVPILPLRWREMVRGDAAANTEAESPVRHERRRLENNDGFDIVVAYDILLQRRRRQGIEAALRQCELDAGLGRLERVFVVLVIARDRQLGGCRIHARDGEHGHNHEQDQADDQRGTLLAIGKCRWLHG
jgi:hypothetical protein